MPRRLLRHAMLDLRCYAATPIYATLFYATPPLLLLIRAAYAMF